MENNSQLKKTKSKIINKKNGTYIQNNTKMK